jgi:S1-C subfamily serine protease
MFANAIKSNIHPATWAVFAVRQTPKGPSYSHRGTAFAVDTTGSLLTCWHVTYEDPECQVECSAFAVAQPEVGLTTYPATLINKDRDRDIALLQIDGKPRTRPAMLTGAPVPFGTSCCSFGHPLSVADPNTGGIRIFTRAAAGIVSMPYGSPRFVGTRPIELYELDFFTHGGSSGGPVFLQNADVFAFVSGSLMVDGAGGIKTRSNLSVAVSIHEAIQFLDALNIKLQVRRGTRR